MTGVPVTGSGPDTRADAKPHDPPLLEVTGLRKGYADTAALDGVDLRMASGQLLALLGPNGAGKTTLLRALCGRARPESGTVRILGNDPRTAARSRQLIGLVPQSNALYPALPVQANLDIFGRLMGLRGVALRSAIDEALHWSGLTARRRQPVGQLSGGMQRRVNIVIGALHAPRLLLLDEPTVGLDPATKAAIHEMLRALRQRGIGIVLTTHDLPEAEDLAERVAFMLDGRILADAPPGELIRHHFPEGRELMVLLHQAPDATTAGALQRAGLNATSRPRLWVGILHGDLGGLEPLRRQLVDAGVPVDELRVREPGLSGVFLRLTGRALAS